MSNLSVEATRWRHVQVADVSRVSVPDAARPLSPQQLRFSICKSTYVFSCWLQCTGHCFSLNVLGFSLCGQSYLQNIMSHFGLFLASRTKLRAHGGASQALSDKLFSVLVRMLLHPRGKNKTKQAHTNGWTCFAGLQMRN